MKRNIFYIHNHKCGGSTARLLLKECGLSFLETSDINVSKNNDAHKYITDYNNNGWLVFGHPDKLKLSKNKSENQILLNRLYEDSLIIFPSKDPVEIMRSWLHYYKTRCNQIIRLLGSSKSLTTDDLDQNEKFMFSAMKNINLIEGISDLHEIKIDATAENALLKKLLKYIMSKGENMSPAWIQTLNLFYPYRKEIYKELFSGRKINTSKIMDLSSERVLIYNCEIYSPLTVNKLSLFLNNSFANQIQEVRSNTSESKRRIKHKELYEFRQIYKKHFSCEFEIYSYAI